MEIAQADQRLAEQHTAEICELVYATGPSSYDYHFGRRELFNHLVRRSWLAPGTLFAWDVCRLALDDGELLGIEIGFEGPGFRTRQAALAPLWPDMMAAGEVEEGEIVAVLERSERAGWLNPVLRPDVYYVHALSVKPEHRGRQIGARLLGNALAQAQAGGFRALELDVLSDNPAVHFYSSMGLSLLVESRAPEPESCGVPPEWRMGITLAA